MKQFKWRIILLFFAVLCISSCKSWNYIEQVYPIDPELQLGLDANEQFENYVYKIREGATPTLSKKSSGGCGCN